MLVYVVIKSVSLLYYQRVNFLLIARDECKTTLTTLYIYRRPKAKLAEVNFEVLELHIPH